MARSTYIYLVTEANNPVAAFTVKHEMESWLVRNPGTYKKLRMRDGWHSYIEKQPIEMNDK